MKNSTPIKSFCPLILFHDNPSESLYQTLTANKQHHQTAIHLHRHKINEMLEINAQFWIANDDDMKPTTISNISSSSSTSGDSVMTEDKKYVSQKKMVKSKSTPIDTTKKRRRGNLPKEVTEFLRKWLIQHKKHPYPAEKEKVDLARHTGLTVNQISNWFINARRRILQPMLESENLHAQFMNYPQMGFEQPSYQGGDLPDTPMPAYSDEDFDHRSIYHRKRLMDIDERYQQLSMR